MLMFNEICDFKFSFFTIFLKNTTSFLFFHLISDRIFFFTYSISFSPSHQLLVRLKRDRKLDTSYYMKNEKKYIIYQITVF